MKRHVGGQVKSDDDTTRRPYTVIVLCARLNIDPVVSERKASALSSVIASRLYRRKSCTFLPVRFIGNVNLPIQFTSKHVRV